MEQKIENVRFCLRAKDVGAELTSFYDKNDDYEYIWQGGPIWDGHSPLLFPIVGRLRDDVYQLEGNTYTMQKHGFARKTPFVVESCKEDEITFLMTDSKETYEGFPYAFELRVTYRLLDNGFEMEHQVKNRNDRTMYFSIGAHPGFNIDLGDKVVMDEPEIAAAFQLDDEKLRGRNKLPVFENSRELVITPEIFENDALIFDGLQSKGASVIKADGRNVHVDFGGAPCLGIWAKPAAPYVCIEPWYGIDDAWNADHDFTRKERICSVNAGENFTFKVTIKV